MGNQEFKRMVLNKRVSSIRPFLDTLLELKDHHIKFTLL